MTQHKTRKLAAIAVGALVIGVGATYTLASWNDSEWVNGGLDGAAGIGTSEFEVLQNATAPYADTAGNWGHHETNPGDELTFSTAALALTPGDTVYAPVALRTAPTSVAGDVSLVGAIPALDVTVDDAQSELWNAVRVSVHTATGAAAPSACAGGFAAAGWTPLLTDAPLGSAASVTQELAAQGGSTQHYCFALTLPTGAPDTLQGRSIAPAWEFASTSK